jgi:hypothetical protein
MDELKIPWITGYTIREAMSREIGLGIEIIRVLPLSSPKSWRNAEAGD